MGNNKFCTGLSSFGESLSASGVSDHRHVPVVDSVGSVLPKQHSYDSFASPLF